MLGMLLLIEFVMNWLAALLVEVLELSDVYEDGHFVFLEDMLEEIP